ncbi:hypothetical protein PG994_007480 [Apiospora phragmitis]|uniref:Uncharacterized protein n=1 Tax=Apiospora phragmitis TaxID=2905665 RepID=A0ABR1V0Z9_9PEZI
MLRAVFSGGPADVATVFSRGPAEEFEKPAKAGVVGNWMAAPAKSAAGAATDWGCRRAHASRALRGQGRRSKAQPTPEGISGGRHRAAGHGRVAPETASLRGRAVGKVGSSECDAARAANH